MNIVRLDTEQTPSTSGGGELVMADAGHLFVVFVPPHTTVFPSALTMGA